MTPHRRTLAAVALASLVWPEAAGAHLVSTGMGPFYDGAMHLVVSPDDLLGVIALALLAGLSGKAQARRLILILPGAWLAGGLIGMTQTGEVLAPAASGVTCLAAGVMLATQVRLPTAGFFAAAGGFGLFHGFLNGTLAAEADLGFTGLMGIVLAGLVLAALLAALAASLEAAWARTAARVAGSWIAAIGLLMVGWAFRS